MRRQSGLAASSAALLVPRNQPQVTAYLAQRVSMTVQLLRRLARVCTVIGQQQMQAWWERLWPNLRTQKIFYLHAFADKEHTVTLRTLLNLSCAVLTLLRCPLRDSLLREATLCQR